MTAELAGLLDALGRDPDERAAICHGAAFTAELTTVEKAPDLAARYSETDCWYSAQPLHERVSTGRGVERDVIGLRELYADLDVKAGGLPDYRSAAAVITDLSAMLGAAPVAVVGSGHGLQPHWAVERGEGADWGDDTDPAWADARALLRRWGRLAARAAEAHGGQVDNVFDLSRVLRVPGTTNRKAEPKPTTAEFLHGAPVSLGQLRECLEAYSVTEWAEDRERLGETVAEAGGWRYAARTCGYVESMVAGWATDTPPNGRHPWLVGQATRLAAAHRSGCLTEQDHGGASSALAARFRALLRAGSVRDEQPGEISDALTWGVTRVETMTDTKVARELGGHQHPPDTSTIDEHAEFWQARPILTHVRDYARARRASPWATLGAVLARVVTQVGPQVQLPPLVGGPMSLNLFTALVGASGAGKDAAIETAAAAVNVGHLEVRTPGSGEGIAHSFVHRVKDNIEQHTTAVLFVAREVDSLAALVARQSATLGAELRIAYTGAQLGFAYADPKKRLAVRAHAYRLCLIVGVQPERAGPLLEEAESGTPQRFLWLPAVDPDAPDAAPPAPAPVTWPRIGPTGPRTVTVCDTARRVIDHARVDRLRGNGHALDGHALLTRLKVAAALGLLDGRLDVTEQDWQLAGTVTSISDVTRGQVGKALAERRAAVNRARGEDEAARSVVVDERTVEHHVQRVARNLVHRLQHGDWMTHAELRRGVTSRDRQWFDDATGRAVKAGQIEVEQVTGQGERGRRYRVAR